MEKFKNIFRIGSAILVFVGLCLSIYNDILTGPFNSTFLNIVKCFTYFTLITNTLIVFWYLFNSNLGFKNKIFNSKSIKGALSLYILVTGIVYFTVLHKTSTLTFYPLVGTYILHGISPILFIIDWILFEKKGQYNWGNISKWVMFPIIYLIYIVILCGFLKDYPYGFMDLTKISTLSFIVNMLVLTIVFTLLSAMIVAIDKLAYRLTKLTSLTENI